jgi:hypothetical protein
MKRSIFHLIAISIFCISASAQSVTLILQPDATTGKDAFLRSLSPSTNYGTHPDLASIAWTNSGSTVLVRSLIEFDITSIPQGAIIDSAYLFLYGYSSPANGSHSTSSGSNASTISRVISSWDENTVTWGNQPQITTQNEVILSASTGPFEDYKINVAALVQDMTNNPMNSHGFMLKLQTEQEFRKMVFASSDYADTTVHPKLKVTYSIPTASDSCFTLKPNSIDGKDAFLRSLSPTTNYGAHPDFASIAWTFSSSPVVVRSLIDFDLSSIPQGATIDESYLNLYTSTTSANNSHSTMSGSNASTISRVITPWSENTVTWSNQPQATSQNEVTLSASTNPDQNYSVNVTNLVQDMIDNMANSHGFLFQLVTEQQFRKMVFASSDDPDTELHPELTVCYTKSTVSVTENGEQEKNVLVYPNPTSRELLVDLSALEGQEYSIVISNSLGQPVYKKVTRLNVVQIDVANMARGLYMLHISGNERLFQHKIMLN